MPRDLLFDKSSPMPVPAEELFHWHTRPGAFARLAPPWQRVEVVGGSTEVANGSRVVLRMAKGPLRFRWRAEHRDVRPGIGFRDVQVDGPFALWEHDHLFEPLGAQESRLRDRIRFRPPAGALGRLLMERGLRRDLESTFRYRHATTRADLELHAAYRDRPALRVAVTGAGGLIGRTLSALLTTGGHRVVRLVRPSAGVGHAAATEVAAWEPDRGLLDPTAVGRLDAVVHLAGENIVAGRWTSRRKRLIRASRVDATRNLVASLERLEQPPRVLVSASAIGFYGDRGEAPIDESAAAGSGFLAEVCSAWERAALAGRRFGMRVALARLGVVFSPSAGFLARVLPPFRLGLGGRLGDGRQWVSWISVDDAAAALLHLLMSEELDGPINLTAPEAVSNRELTTLLGRLLKRPTALPMPAAVARTIFGEVAEETMLAGARARPARLLSGGYRFRHAQPETALRHLLGLPDAA